ncbi:MAG: hypothetical protein HFH31_04575 [Bacilli bacterium]|nr:hypothetical protein [Bacilli bacterium]
MQKISALNQNNQPLEIEIIRYLKKDDKRYLIFSLGEKDEQGYSKVYVSKILGLNGTLAAYDIIDATEWANVKDLVKKIIKANREGEALDIVDLSVDRLNNIKINGQQVFKLISNLIELLGSNLHIIDEDNESAEVSSIPEVENMNQENSVIPNDEKVSEAVKDMPVPISNNVEVATTTEEATKNVVDNQAQEPVNTMSNSPTEKAEESNEYQKLYKEIFDRYEKLLEENTKLKTQLDNIKMIINK